MSPKLTLNLKQLTVLLTNGYGKSSPDLIYSTCNAPNVTNFPEKSMRKIKLTILYIVIFSSFAAYSTDNLHPDLKMVLNVAKGHINFVVIEGLRSKSRQKELYKQKKTSTLNSKHLIQSDGYVHAVDLAPNRPIIWRDKAAFAHLCGILRGIGMVKGVKLRCGVDWDQDLQTIDHKLFDGPHVELIK